METQRGRFSPGFKASQRPTGLPAVSLVFFNVFFSPFPSFFAPLHPWRCWRRRSTSDCGPELAWTPTPWRSWYWENDHAGKTGECLNAHTWSSFAYSLTRLPWGPRAAPVTVGSVSRFGDQVTFFYFIFLCCCWISIPLQLLLKNTEN